VGEVGRVLWSSPIPLLSPQSQLEKLLLQLNQGKQSSRQVKRSLDRASLTSIGPEALQTQYKAYGLLLAMAMLYYMAT